MLRITVIENPETVTLQIEGRLVGPWVQELERCWRTCLASPRRRGRRLDLTGVTFIDAAGKTLLGAMYAQGAELIAGGCLMRAVVAEVTNLPIPDDLAE